MPGQVPLSLSHIASSQPRCVQGAGCGQPELPLRSSRTISELQAEEHTATYSGEHRNKVLPPKAPPIWGRHGRSSERERVQMDG